MAMEMVILCNENNNNNQHTRIHELDFWKKNIRVHHNSSNNFITFMNSKFPTCLEQQIKHINLFSKSNTTRFQKAFASNRAHMEESHQTSNEHQSLNTN
jgi:hypothetical protein